jgi:hypothetical protein
MDVPVIVRSDNGASGRNEAKVVLRLLLPLPPETKRLIEVHFSQQHCLRLVCP